MMRCSKRIKLLVAFLMQTAITTTSILLFGVVTGLPMAVVLWSKQFYDRGLHGPQSNATTQHFALPALFTF
jgi:hypothetical protein